MARAYLLVSTLLCAALVLGCLSNDPGDDTHGVTTTSGNQSGSVTSAPGSATDSSPTTTTLTSPGSSDDTASASEACNFVCGDMPMGDCDLWAQDCPEGQKCTAYISGDEGFWNASQCVDVTGTDKPGEGCTVESYNTGVDSCIKGAMCWGFDREGVGTCVALCTGSWEAAFCPGMGFCTISDTGVLNLCLDPGCDPLLQDCGDPTAACYAVGEAFVCALDVSGDQGQANDPCESINDCDVGLTCTDAALVGMACTPGLLGCCTPFCKFPDGACPNPDQQCVQYFDPMQLPPDDPWLDVGVCGVAS